MTSSLALACTKSSIQQFAQFGYSNACQYVKDACSDETSHFDFFNLYYCSFNESVLLFLPFSFMFLAATFYIISSTAENYLEPVLSKIAKRLGLSESLAGVTLVGLANGAPDVFAAFAAGGKPKGGILIPLGALLGAALFTTSIVLAACIISSPNKQVRANKNALKRDCLFYMMCLLYILMLGFIGEISLVGSIGFFLQYMIFIGVVFYQESRNRRQRNSQVIQLESHEAPHEPDFTVTYHGDDVFQTINLTDSLLLNDHLKNDEADTSDCLSSGLNVTGDESTMLARAQSDFYKTKPAVYYQLRHRIWREFREIHQKNKFWKTIHIMIYPVKLARDLTVPAPSNSQWDKGKAIIQPFTVTLFLLWQFGIISILQNSIILTIYTFACIALSGLIWKFTQNSEVPGGVAGFFMKIIAFIASVTWINLLANTVVDLISLLTVFTSLPLNYLSLTLLCFGNSTGDFFVDSTLAKKGYDQTAVSGIFGGQYFNLAIGFGASLIRQIIQSGPKEFNFGFNGSASIINMVLIGCILMNFTVVLLWGRKNDYIFRKNFSYYSLGMYICFLMSVTFLCI